jgi:hypothetical protein
MSVDIRKGEHMPPDVMEPISPGHLGSMPSVPFEIAPNDWHENGVPYGAWCKCQTCGVVGRSTMAFDFYTSGPGMPYDCEDCAQKKLK